MECIGKGNPPVCKLACRGLYADVTKRYVEKPPLDTESQFLLIFSREGTDEKEQSDAEKLMKMKQEYERYKDLWGLNLHYSHSAGPSQNYSELKLKSLFSILFQPRKKALRFKWCTSTLTLHHLPMLRRM